jgi:Stage II sporulation protein E (SpoIIE)
VERTALARLIADGEVGPRIAELADRAAAIAPGITVTIGDVDGSPLLVAGVSAPADETAATAEMRKGDEVIGQVRVAGPPALATLEAIADLVGGAVHLAFAAQPDLDARPAAGDEPLEPSPTAGPAVVADPAADHRVEGELAIGRRIQRSLMPRRFPSLPGWEIAAAYDAAREVGGDLYDAFLLRNRPGCLGLVIADVTGKGIPAALVMADVRALIHAAADHGGGPAVTIDRVNRILVAERATGLFVTVAHAELDAQSGSRTLASAGHEPVHVVRNDGTLDILEPPGCLVGMVAEIRVDPVDATLGPGDALVMHTDGVTEARDPTGGFYGDDRLRDLLRSVAGRPASAIVDAIVADVTAFRAGAEAFDDLTLLVVRRAANDDDAVGPATDGEASAIVDVGGSDDVVVDVASG